MSKRAVGIPGGPRYSFFSFHLDEIAVYLPVPRRGAVLGLLEHAVEGGDGAEAGGHGDVLNGLVGVDQPLLRHAYALLAQVFGEGDAVRWV